MREYYYGVYASLFIWALLGLFFPPPKWYNFLVCAMVIGYCQLLEYLWKKNKKKLKGVDEK